MNVGKAVPKEEQKLETAILWCRRDLRVTDNPALNAALQLAKRVVRTRVALTCTLP
jgi:deoxyribodipyrimidine photolyase